MNEGSRDCSKETAESSEGWEGTGRREKGITGQRMDQTEEHEIGNETGRQHKLECGGRKATMIKGVVVILEMTIVKATWGSLGSSGAE